MTTRSVGLLESTNTDFVVAYSVSNASAGMTEQRKVGSIITRKRKYKWAVDYDLLYDNGDFAFTSYYRYLWQAKLMKFVNVHILSWGGKSRLYSL